MMFSSWLSETKKLQKEAFGADPASLEGDARADFATWNMVAIDDELAEARDNIGWKTWAKPRGWLKEDEFIGELIDVLHFVGNLLVLAGCDDEMLSLRYKEKMDVNRARQRDGYDGVSTKCPVCKRALDDPAVRCTKEICAA